MIDSAKATRVLVAFLLLISLPSFAKSGEDGKANDQAVSESRFYLSTGDRSGTPLTESKTSFNCSEKVYLVAVLKDLPAGKHVFTVLWREPSGNTREKTEYDFNVSQAESKLWAWLRLSRARGAGMLTWINPAAGLEEFIGEWSVEVKIDQKRVNKGTFTVTC